VADARCRHRDSWLIAGGTYEWCFRCGAFRRMRETGIAQVAAMSPWLRPVGPDAPNPWEQFNEAAKRFTERQARKKR
jgi:hypothetical protein